jgi:putative ABC transport system permease protein
MIDRFLSAVRGFLTRRRAERELDDELQFHLEMETEANVARGMAASDARRAALRGLGGKDQTKEAVRDVRGVWLDSVLRDVAHAGRWFRRDRAVSLSAVLTVALSVGPATVLFSVAEAVLLRPLPYHEPERLLSIWRTLDDVDFAPLTVGDLYDLRSHATSLSGVAGMERDGALLMTDSVTEWADAYRVTPNLFQVLGVRSLLGRVFRADEERPGKDHVAVITERFWRDVLLGDAAIVGRRLRLKPEGTGAAAAETYEVIGVVATDVEFFYPTRIHADVYIPRTVKATDLADQGRSSSAFFAVARVRSGTTLDQATGEIRNVVLAANRAHPGLPFSNTGVRVSPLHEELVGRTRPRFLLLGGAALVLLLIGSVNVANLLLAAGLRRAPEMVTRLTLGCSRWRLVRQLLTENLLLASAGGVLGVAFAYWMLPLLVHLAPTSIPRIADSQVNVAALTFAVVATCCVASLATLAPAVLASRPRSPFGVVGQTTTRRRSFLKDGLIVFETAMMLVLVGVAILIGRSAWRLAHVDVGFRPSGVLAASLVVPERFESVAARSALKWNALQSVRSLPGVRQATVASELPFTWGVLSGITTRPNRVHRGVVNEIDPAYFSVLGIPLVRGRAFTPADVANKGVVLVSQSLVRFLGTTDAVGQQVRVEGEWREIVGVVGDVTEVGALAGGVIRRPGLERMNIPAAYVPLGTADTSTCYLLVQTDQSEAAAISAVTRQLRAVDPELTLRRAGTLERRVASARSETRFSAFVLCVFAAVALLLSAIGLYATLSHSVSQRTREIGIRAALGATPRQVQLGVVGRVYVLVAVGCLAGAALWWLGGRAIRGFLFEITPSDPWTLGAAGLVLLLVAFLAGWLPTRRATRLEPTFALRLE